MLIHSSRDNKRLNHLISEIEAAYHEMSLKLGLSDSAMQILYTVCDSEDGKSCLLKDVCRLTGISKQTLHSSIRKLEQEGFVRLEPAGAKNKRISLTEKGNLLATHTAAKIIAAENNIFASWPKKDVETYLKLTHRYLEDLRKEIGKLNQKV